MTITINRGYGTSNRSCWWLKNAPPALSLAVLLLQIEAALLHKDFVVIIVTGPANRDEEQHPGLTQERVGSEWKPCKHKLGVFALDYSCEIGWGKTQSQQISGIIFTIRNPSHCLMDASSFTSRLGATCKLLWFSKVMDLPDILHRCSIMGLGLFGTRHLTSEFDQGAFHQQEETPSAVQTWEMQCTG